MKRVEGEDNDKTVKAKAEKEKETKPGVSAQEKVDGSSSFGIFGSQ